ncbi:MAG TPA: hypothetical protein VNB23_02280 [Ramlibacter sp.]|nr:hypothetical protein [Ramlibacter sp.]
MTTQYARSTGRRLTYTIHTDDRGRYSVHLDGKELLRGRDALCEDGRSRRPNKRKAVGALNEAKLAIESLRGMSEF